ncbi:hypothetical protein DUI87_09233 [Hirundo rustica rustica]|uniref:Uncharacterized protein n=1 Tax=Hirundo rustica rustica TaxID=333673 RepID=A0A3M0KS17_HIRRU|nr:hypothetical protein DUI87_09233 [Hirundo rustica rustica]
MNLFARSIEDTLTGKTQYASAFRNWREERKKLQVQINPDAAFNFVDVTNKETQVQKDMTAILEEAVKGRSESKINSQISRTKEGNINFQDEEGTKTA